MPAFAMRKGDWLCRNVRLLDGTACGNLNMAFRNECNKCNIARPDIEVVELRLELKSKQREIDELKAMVKAMGRSPRSPAWAPIVTAQSVATAEEVKKEPTSDEAVVVAMLAALSAALAR